jgi:acyl carrier protein
MQTWFGQHHERGGVSMRIVDVEAIQHWLVTQIAEQLGIEPQDLDVRLSFSAYGLDSITGVSLAGDLEEWLNVSLAPTLLWDYSTVETLAQYLAEAVVSQPAKTVETRSGTCVSPRDIMGDSSYAAHVLAQLDTLSDEDVDALLADLVAA